MDEVSFIYIYIYIYIYRSFATRVSQLKIWHFLIIGMERNVCRCNFSRYSVITQFAKLAAGEQLCCHCTIETCGTSKPLKVSPEKSQVLGYDTAVQMSNIYIHLNKEMNAWCNSSGVQENLINSKLVNSEYHIIRSMTFLSITCRILCTP